MVGDEEDDITFVITDLLPHLAQEQMDRKLKEGVKGEELNILVAYLMNEYAVVTYAFKEGNLKKCLESGMLDENFQCKTAEKDLYSYIRIEDIDFLNQATGLKREKIIGVDGATDYIRPVLNQLSEEDFQIFIKYNMS